MKSNSIKYSIAFFLILLFSLKGVAPLMYAALSNNETIEMVSETEPEQNEKPCRQLIETEVQDFFTAAHIATLSDGGLHATASIPLWQPTIYKQKVYVGIPTPPPKEA